MDLPSPRLLKSSEQCSPFYMPQEEAKCGTWPKDMPHLTPGLEHGFVMVCGWAFLFLMCVSQWVF